MAWHRPGDKPLSEPMMLILLTHICASRPQWVKLYIQGSSSSTFFQASDMSEYHRLAIFCINVSGWETCWRFFKASVVSTERWKYDTIFVHFLMGVINSEAFRASFTVSCSVWPKQLAWGQPRFRTIDNMLVPLSWMILAIDWMLNSSTMPLRVSAMWFPVCLSSTFLVAKTWLSMSKLSVM